MTKPSDWVQERLDRSPIRSLRSEQYPDRALLCKKLGISDSVIYFAELACYPTLPVRLAKLLLPDERERKNFQSVYHHFQLDERKLFGFQNSLEEVTRLNLQHAGESPVYALCSHLGFSRADLGKGLCLQPSLLYRHDRGMAQSLASEFRVALLQSGISLDVVNYLDDRQRRYAA